MDRGEFLKQQYVTLREEIKETKGRIFKLVGLGIFVVPATQFVAQAYQLDIVMVSIPLLVIVVALLYLSENHALMRCGRYIRKHIESEVDGIVGWETWLELADQQDRRTVDKYLSYCFYLLFFVYYAGSVFLAGRFTLSQFGLLHLSVLLGFYSAIGIWFLIFLIGNIRTSTTTRLDQKDSQEEGARQKVLLHPE